MKKLVSELKPEDVIDPPTGERCWLWADGVKRQYTIIEIRTGRKTKKGQFLRISYKYPSVHKDCMSLGSCDMLATKSIKVY